MKRICIGVLACLAVILFLAGAVILLRDAEHDEVIRRPESTEVSNAESGQDDASEESVTEGTEETESKEEASETETDSSSESSSEEAEPLLVTVAEEPIENPYLEYFDQNEDMAAWLLIPDTKIDEPVMWTPGDENYYLNRNFKKKSDKNGCLILDTDSCLDPITTNQIIHGHNMKSGRMFGTLMKYEDPDYAKEHPYIYLYEKDIPHGSKHPVCFLPKERGGQERDGEGAAERERGHTANKDRHRVQILSVLSGRYTRGTGGFHLQCEEAVSV